MCVCIRWRSWELDYGILLLVKDSSDDGGEKFEEEWKVGLLIMVIR